MDKDLASRLWDARLGGDVIALDALPPDEASAYAIQRAITEVGGGEVMGYKIGATAQPTMDLMGLTQPFFGPMYAPWRYLNGDPIPIVPAQRVGLETEFAFGLNADLPTDGSVTIDDIRSALEWVAPAFEVIGFRTEGEVAGAGMRLIADGGANVGLVLGEPVRDWQRIDFAAHRATLDINGAQTAEGHGGVSLFGDALSPLVWLANHAENDRGLRAGDVIITGTVTGITPLEIGMQARADFGTLGEVSCTFTA